MKLKTAYYESDERWRWAPNEVFKACCSSMPTIITSFDGMSGGDYTNKDEFNFSVYRDGLVVFQAEDPFYYITDIQFCPYCGEEITVEKVN